MHSCQLTGDDKDEESIAKCSLIISTPEKIEFFTRNAKNLDLLTRNLKLVLIEEIQSLGDVKRGHILEGFICRLKIVEIKTGNTIRFITSTATVGDLDSICNFFGSKTKKIKYNEETRSVPLEKIVIGFDQPDNYSEFKFDNILGDHLLPIIEKYQKGQQVLVFCPVRKIAEKTADYLRRGNFKRYVSNQNEMLETARKVDVEQLKHCMLSGVAYYHGGLTMKDKAMVEQAYKRNLISVLCCTPSLTIGINFPSNVVIVKGTFRYNNSTIIQINEADINQMIGRTGTQQLANSAASSTNRATAIIMTKNCHKHLYEQVLSEKSVESQLRDNLCEVINTEIILNHLKSFDDILNYTKRTYLYIRLQINPELYGISKQSNIDDSIKRWITRILSDLNLHKVISSDGADKQFNSINKTPIGQIMNEYCVSFISIKRFNNKIVRDLNIDSLLFLLCECKELTDQAMIRNDEKNLLSDLNKGNNLKFPIRNKNTHRISDLNQKVNCLIQAELGGLFDAKLQNLAQEANRHLKTAKLLAKALVEYLYLQSGKSFSTFKSAILLSKSLHAGKYHHDS